MANALVTNLRAPGGNVTGVVSASTQAYQKRLEFFKQLKPTASHIALLSSDVHGMDRPARDAVAVRQRQCGAQAA